MKVVVISPGFPPTLGGVETVVAEVSTRMAQLGVDVEVWAQDRGVRGSARVRVIDRLKVRLFAANSSVRFGVSWRLWVHAFRQLRDVDLVHTHSYHVSSCLAALLAPRSTPIVFTPHFHGRGHTRLARMLHPLYQHVASRLLRRSVAIVAVSEAESVLLTATFSEVAHKCVVIRNAVASDDIHGAEPLVEPPTLLVLGRLERYKQVALTIEAFSQCEAVGQLVIIGDGPDRERVMAYAAGSPRAGDIRILGYRPREEVTRWLRTARGVVSMSKHEAFGIVAMEGVAAGAAVILSELPAHREVQSLAPDGVVRLLRAGDSAFSRELDQALNTPNAGPRPIRDWSTVVEEHLELYNRLVK